MENKNNKLLSYYAGFLSGSLNKFITHPIDTIKTNIQISKIQNDIRLRSIITVSQRIYKAQGIKGFYQGVWIASLMGAPASSLFFGFYDYFKAKLSSSNYLNNDFKYFIAAMGAEAVSCVLWVPIDVIKERLQVQNNLKIYKYKNSFDAIKTILKNEGIFKIYSAYGGTLLSFGPTIGINLLFYEKIKKYLFSERKASTFEHFLIAFSSSVIGSIIINPIEISKIRMQVDRASSNNKGQKGHDL